MLSAPKPVKPPPSASNHDDDVATAARVKFRRSVALPPVLPCVLCLTSSWVSGPRSPTPNVFANFQTTLARSPETHYPNPSPVMFTPHANLANEVNHAIIQSEVEGGVFLHDLPPSTVLHIQTMHHCYPAVLLGGRDPLLSGHPEFSPHPVHRATPGS